MLTALKTFLKKGITACLCKTNLQMSTTVTSWAMWSPTPWYQGQWWCPYPNSTRNPPTSCFYSACKQLSHTWVQEGTCNPCNLIAFCKHTTRATIRQPDRERCGMVGSILTMAFLIWGLLLRHAWLELILKCLTSFDSTFIGWRLKSRHTRRNIYTREQRKHSIILWYDCIWNLYSDMISCAYQTWECKLTKVF